jgi:hypothetical protein
VKPPPIPSTPPPGTPYNRLNLFHIDETGENVLTCAGLVYNPPGSQDIPTGSTGLNFVMEGIEANYIGGSTSFVFNLDAVRIAQV